MEADRDGTPHPLSSDKSKEIAHQENIVVIVDFFRRILDLRNPEKTGKDIPLEKWEITKEKEKVEEKKA